MPLSKSGAKIALGRENVELFKFLVFVIQKSLFKWKGKSVILI